VGDGDGGQVAGALARRHDDVEDVVVNDDRRNNIRSAAGPPRTIEETVVNEDLADFLDPLSTICFASIPEGRERIGVGQFGFGVPAFA
jgi:hypothetical protein